MLTSSTKIAGKGECPSLGGASLCLVKKSQIIIIEETHLRTHPSYDHLYLSLLWTHPSYDPL